MPPKLTAAEKRAAHNKEKNKRVAHARRNSVTVVPEEVVTGPGKKYKAPKAPKPPPKHLVLKNKRSNIKIIEQDDDNNDDEAFQEDEGHSKTPWFTLLLVTLNCIGMLVEMTKADWEFASIDDNPMVGPNIQALVDSGALTSITVICEGQWWRIFVSFFLHAGFMHLGFNMMVLLLLGWPLEQDFGPFDMAAIYMTSGIIGQLASSVFLSNSVSVGASGAIFGLVGAQWADYLQNYAFFDYLNEETFGGRTGFLMLALTSLFLICYSLDPSFNAFCHIGGLFTGSLVGYILMIRPRIDREEFEKGNIVRMPLEPHQKALKFAAGAAIVCELITLVHFFGVDDVYEACNWCEYLQCFDTPQWDCDDYFVASCSQRAYVDLNICTKLDPDFEGNCVVITCLDDTQHPFNTEVPATANDCYTFCGADYTHCRGD